MENNQTQTQTQINRPWFRLASQIRMEPPMPRPPLGPSPTFTQAVSPPTVVPPQTQSQPQPQTQPQPQPQSAQSQAPAPSVTAPPAPVVVRSPLTSVVPPSSQMPATPAPRVMSIRRAQEPGPSTASPAARVVEEPPKMMSSSLPTSPIRKSQEFTPSSDAPLMKTVETSSRALSSSLPVSPRQRGTTRATSPPGSPKTIRASSRTPPQSPVTKPSAPPPSPLSLPPAQLNSVPEPENKNFLAGERKNVLPHEQKGSREEPLKKTEGDKSYGAHGGKVGGGRGLHHKEKDNHKKLDDHEDTGMRVITIAGDNKGAYMELGSSFKNKGNTHPHTLHNHNKAQVRSEGNESGTSNGEEGKSKRKEKAKTNFPMTAFVNSNVQGVNNSILFNTSCTHSDPGVHFVFSRKPVPGQGINLKDQTNNKQT